MQVISDPDLEVFLVHFLYFLYILESVDQVCVRGVPALYSSLLSTRLLFSPLVNAH